MKYISQYVYQHLYAVPFNSQYNRRPIIIEHQCCADYIVCLLRDVRCDRTSCNIAERLASLTKFDLFVETASNNNTRILYRIMLNRDSVISFRSVDFILRILCVFGNQTSA